MLPNLTILKDFAVGGKTVFVCDGWDAVNFTCACDEELQGGTVVGVLRVHRVLLRAPCGINRECCSAH